MVEALQHAGVRCVFGLPGTQTLELFEALRQSRIRTVVATNELSAAFMAGGWARVTGEPGVLLTISGPGFTWALTGIAEARLDSVPLVHLMGAPAPDPVKRSFRQQELDHDAIATPLVKGIVDTDSYDDPADAVFEALQLARSGEPGPVLLQVTSALLAKNLETDGLGSLSVPTSDRAGVDAVCARLAGARRPILLVGPGTNRCADQLRILVERLHAPVITTPSARGVIPESHPLNLGFYPMAGNVGPVNEFLKTGDLILAIGSKLSHSDTAGFEMELPADRLIHLDASAEVIEANYPASLGAVGDVGDLLRQLLDSHLTRSTWADSELEGWRRRIGSIRTDFVEPHIAGTPGGDAASFFRAMRRALPDDSTLVLDSGLHQVLARRYYSVQAPYGLMMPTDLQSMGFAIPTAIGVKLACPDDPVVALVGDGGFAMTAMELLSAVREKISLTIIVFVDGAFGQIRVQQLANYGTGHGVTLRNPDFQLFALSVGARYEAVGDTDSIEDILRAALQVSGVTLIEVGVEDAFPLRRVAATARAREVTRRAAGPRVFRFIARLFRRR
jgi:acetolactate synthase-1/2/3 large subunit